MQTDEGFEEYLKEEETTNEVLDFIKRRFPLRCDCNWTTGNCYYFALILKDRFPHAEICYNLIDGHFFTFIGLKAYDWHGIYPITDDMEWIEWDHADNYDKLVRNRIERDCIL